MVESEGYCVLNQTRDFESGFEFTFTWISDSWPVFIWKSLSKVPQNGNKCTCFRQKKAIKKKCAVNSNVSFQGQRHHQETMHYQLEVQANPKILHILLYSCKQCKRKYSKVKWIRTLEPFVIQRSTLPFRGEEPNFQEQLQNFEVAASKFQHQSSFHLNNLGRSKWELKKDYGIIPFLQ